MTHKETLHRGRHTNANTFCYRAIRIDMLSEIVLSSEAIGILIVILLLCVCVGVYFLWEDTFVRVEEDEEEKDSDDDTPTLK